MGDYIIYCEVISRWIQKDSIHLIFLMLRATVYKFNGNYEMKSDLGDKKGSRKF